MRSHESYNVNKIHKHYANFVSDMCVRLEAISLRREAQIVIFLSPFQTGIRGCWMGGWIVRRNHTGLGAVFYIHKSSATRWDD
jgi:hypothetical protein